MVVIKYLLMFHKQQQKKQLKLLKCHVSGSAAREGTHIYQFITNNDALFQLW